jgi:hypothetical protein
MSSFAVGVLETGGAAALGFWASDKMAEIEAVN